MKIIRSLVLAAVAGGFWSAVPAAAQPLGSFRWQLQPYCNVITLAVVQQGGQYQLDGTDDQCGAAQAASVRGMAFLNLNGTIGFGLTIVTAPGGIPVHVDATITLPGLNGTWRDSAGNTGNLIFGAGVPSTGPRPVSTSGLAPGSVTTVLIAPSAVTNAQIAANAVTGANIANGSISSVDLADGPRAAFASGEQLISLTATDEVVRTITLSIPASGRVIVSASGFFQFADANPAVTELGRCTITTGTAIEFAHLIASSDAQSTDTSASASQFAGTRGFNVTAGSFTVNLVCDESSGNVVLHDSSLTAIFVAS